MIENGNLYNRAARFLDKEITELLFLGSGSNRAHYFNRPVFAQQFWYDQAENEWVCVLQEGLLSGKMVPEHFKARRLGFCSAS